MPHPFSLSPNLWFRRFAPISCSLFVLAALLFSTVMPANAGSIPEYRPFLPQHQQFAQLLSAFEVPVRGGWKISTAPGTDYDHAIGQANQHSVDLAPLSGADLNLYAPFDGLVTIFPDPNPGKKIGAGNRVRIVHSNGYQTDLFHLSSFSVKTGDQVKKGQKVGVVGTTGNSTGVHVHWQFQPTTGAWTSVPMYGIKGLKFLDAPNSTGFFPKRSGDYYGVAQWEPAQSRQIVVALSSYVGLRSWNCRSFQTQIGTFEIKLKPVSSDIDLYLLNSNGSQIARSIKGGTAEEFISWTPNFSGTIQACAYGYQSGNYALEVALVR